MTKQDNQQTYGSRLMGSIRGILGGIVLLFIALIILWRNEGRTDYSRIADDSVAISASTVNSSTDGEFVAANGILTANEPIGDRDYLKTGEYVKLRRNVEMFAWAERSETDDNDVTTTYYEQVWTERPADSAGFRESAEHRNPPLSISEQEFAAATGKVGAYNLNLNSLQLPAYRDLSLDKSMLARTSMRLSDNFIYLGNGSLASPRIGDVRISYEVIPSGLNVTVFGDQRGDQITTHLHNRDTSLYRAYEGSREAGIASMRSAYKTTGWVMRGLGFGAMWLGLTLLLAPISAVLSFIPVLGNLSRAMLRLLTFGIAFIVSLFVIVVSAIAHSVVALIVIALLVAGGLYLFKRDDLPRFAKS